LRARVEAVSNNIEVKFIVDAGDGVELGEASARPLIDNQPAGDGR
jgi:hypothetical protein